VDRRIRQVAALLTFVMLAIAARAGYIQELRAEDIATYEPVSEVNPEARARNPFRIFQECRWERGAILSLDGQVLAESVPAPEARRCHFERRYPRGGLAPHVVGQWSLHFGKTGLESAYNRQLVGDPVPPTSFADLLTERPRQGNNVVSTIDTRLQSVANEALGGRRGGVVALNPRTGAVYVAASNPSYDPNPLASNDRAVATRARCELGIGVELDGSGNAVRDEQGQAVPCRNPHSPTLSVALQGRRPPGSSFKVVTAAAALETGEWTATSPSVPASRAYTAPGDTRPIGNFGGGSCGGNLIAAMRVSCNTAFARIAVDIGEDQLYATAQAMGLDRVAGSGFVGCEGGAASDIQETRTGCLPRALRTADREERLSTAGYRARAGFGQWVIQTSPFGMAMVAATIANGGFVPRPRFADRVIDPRTGETVEEIRTGVGAQAASTENARAVAEMMRQVVTNGTASAAFRGSPHPVAGKTGTAQQPSCSSDEQAIFGRNCGRLPHAWFIAFAPVEEPTIAVAVLVERGGGSSEAATGGRFAAPIARTVIEEFFRLYPNMATGGGQR